VQVDITFISALKSRPVAIKEMSHAKNETGDELKILLCTHEYSSYETIHRT